MNGIVRNILFFVLVLIVPSYVFAQQDSTVEWKLSLQNLGHRLASLSAGDASGMAAWRADAEELRSSLNSFAESHTEMQIEIPESLPEKPAIEELQPQLSKLTAAVDQVIQQSPGSPFHLGTVSVTVSAEN